MTSVEIDQQSAAGVSPVASNDADVGTDVGDGASVALQLCSAKRYLLTSRSLISGMCTHSGRHSFCSDNN